MRSHTVISPWSDQYARSTSDILTALVVSVEEKRGKLMEIVGGVEIVVALTTDVPMSCGGEVGGE